MNEFLNSLKDDLLDRRMLALVAALGLTLVAALGYAVLGGGSSSAPPPPGVPPSAHVAGIAVTQAPANPNEAVAETANGYTVQRAGHNARDPFKSLVPPAAKANAASKKAASPKGTSKPSTGGSKPSTGSTTPANPPKPASPKPQTVYHVSVLFGSVPAGSALGSPLLTPQLKAYQSLKQLTPLPSAKQVLARFLGVTAKGKSAVFSLGETIIHGNGVCIPSNSQCQAIALKPTQNEQLQYLAPNGEVITYELRLVGIASGTASAASLAHDWRNGSKAARELVGKAGMQAVSGLLFSQTVGELVPAPRRASGPRARYAVQHPRPRD
jgi:hypothetical protein